MKASHVAPSGKCILMRASSCQISARDCDLQGLPGVLWVNTLLQHKNACA